MFNQLRSYEVRYLLPYRLDVSAIQDKKVAGYYHHRALIVGESTMAVIAQVRDMGGLPVSVKVARSRWRVFRRMDQDYKQQFLKAIYYNSSAMSASKALEAVIESDNSSLREMLNPALMIVKRGGSFMEAMDAIGEFDESTLAILEAGERMGTLQVSIDTAVQHLASSAVTNKAMMGIVSIASVELLFAMASLVGNRYGVLPSLIKNVPETTPPEKVLEIQRAVDNGMLFNDFMIWGTVLIIAAGMIGVFAYFDRDKKFRKWVDDKVMLIPQLSQVILNTAAANSFKIAASLIEGGVHLTVAMGIAVKSTRVPRVIEYWETAMRRTETGDSVAGALMQPLLDNSDRVLISAHKESADLAESFKNIAAKRLDRGRSAAKKFSYLLFIGMAVYSMIAVAASLYVVYIQNSALLSEMKG